MIWSIAVAAFLVTLVGLFITGIKLFWYNKFRKFCTFLQLLCLDANTNGNLLFSLFFSNSSDWLTLPLNSTLDF